MLPRRVSSYLFETSGHVRQQLFDVNPLAQLIGRYREDLFQTVKQVFQPGWPEADADVTTDVELEGHVDGAATQLQLVIRRLRNRLRWAHNEIRRLNRIKEAQGTLDAEDDAHYRRCDRMIKKLKGVYRRRRNEAEGVDDTITFSVLAAEGFLPGYGLDSGSIRGTAEVPYWHLGSVDFTLPRSPSIALREYVPGNLIYANGHKFVARHFQREAEGELVDEPIYEVNVERQAVTVSDIGLGATSFGATDLQAISVCDVQLVHQSQIGDDEENRFQMSVATYGRERGRHNGGVRYDWGEKHVSLRRAVHYRMVNVGPSGLAERTPPELGYPVCMVCGKSVSPLASERQLEHFRDSHDERCGKRPLNVGFYADVVADSITIAGLENHIQAYSLMEAIRMAATRVLDMHMQDLQLLVVGHVDRDEVDAVLWDPMPGGSGLLQQIKDHFGEVAGIACEILSGCPADCGSSCSECLQNFRNGFYHKFLDRHAALSLLERWGRQLGAHHDIPVSQPTTASSSTGMPVNDAETKLKHLLEAAGFAAGEFQEQIRFKQPIMVDHQIGSTTPDVFFAGDMDDDDDLGTCIYLDGLSGGLHGNPATQARDAEIRSWLRNNGYNVIAISAVELDDRGAMVSHFKRLARYLEGRSLANQIAANDVWFDQANEACADEAASPDLGNQDSSPIIESEIDITQYVQPEYHELIRIVSERGAVVPVPGYELVDESDIVFGQCSLAWPEQQVCVIESEFQGLVGGLEASGWTVFVVESGNVPVDEILNAIVG